MNALRNRLSIALIATLLALSTPVFAQHEGHSMPSEEDKKAEEDPHAGDHAGPETNESEERKANEGHAGHAAHVEQAPSTDAVDHSMHQGHQGATSEQDLPADAEPRTPIPPVTDADRAAAFPPTHGHAAHDRTIHSYWLADRLEWQDTDEGSIGWEGLAWIGGDINRVWLRSEGESADGDIESGDIEVLYGRAVGRWWDGVVGIKHDFGEGPARNWAAFGVQGLAPYKFEVEATAYVGSSGRTALTLETEYDTLLTNRWILQWQAEASLYGKDDEAVGIASGLSTIELGARLRYEVTRQFAPYVGVEYERAFGGTADLRREDDESVSDARLVAGVRFWF